MSNALTVQNNDLISFDSAKLALIKKTVARDLTDMEFEFFTAVARSRGLDPILNQIHAVVRGTGDKAKMTIQVAIDGFRLIASRTGDFAGIDAPKFKYDKDGNPTRCQVTVYRMVQGQRCAFVAEAKWDEFVPEGNQAFMWKKMPEVMLAKVTEAQALRKAFPADLSGLYADEEMQQADSRDVTPPNNEPPKASIPQTPAKEASRPATSVKATSPDHKSGSDARLEAITQPKELKTFYPSNYPERLRRDPKTGAVRFIDDFKTDELLDACNELEKWKRNSPVSWRKDCEKALELIHHLMTKNQPGAQLTEDDLNFDAYPGELPKYVRDADAKEILKKVNR